MALPPIEILLVRHGQTDANATGVLQGHLPTPLNDLGRAQAAQLARRLARWSPAIDALVASDLPRAAQTAAVVADACGLAPALDAAWRERGFGPLEGTAVGEAETWRAASGADLPGAEPADAFRARVGEALVGLRARFPGARTVAVVTHGGPLRAVLRMLADGSLARAADEGPPALVTLANCAITHLADEGGAWRVRAVNDTAHLAAVTTRDAG